LIQDDEDRIYKFAFFNCGQVGDETRRATFEVSRIRLGAVKRPDRTVQEFAVLGLDCGADVRMAETRPTSGAQRLAKDFEALIESSQARLMLALTWLIARRIAHDDGQIS
jgi:hypothetical protein